MRRMLSTRGAGALLAAVLLLAAGCSSGGGEGAAKGDRTPSSSAGVGASAEASPRSGPPATADPAVLDRPEVRAVEEWAAGYARAVNRSDHSFAATASLVTAGGRDWMERNARSEWGRHFPGPLPVTPLTTRRVDDTRRVVTACVMLSGWSWESRAARRARSREVVGVTMRVVQASGRWRFDGMGASAEVDCTGVEARSRRW